MRTLSTLNGSNGFTINGIDAEDNLGWSVNSAGDVNGDGLDDLIIGARFAEPSDNNDAGESYVIFGSNNGFASNLDVSTLNGTNGFKINGIDTDDSLGWSVNSAGDFNGDGFDDLIIGAPFADPNENDDAGESYVVFGSNNEFASNFDVSSLDGTNGFKLNGVDAGDISGRAVNSAGDVNGDGFDDLIIGARFAEPNDNDDAGESYVVFGSDNEFASSFDLSTLDGTNGFKINGIDAYDLSGFSVSGAGDLNGDGFDDLIIGARDADPNEDDFQAGESYVVFGSNNEFASSLDLSTLDGTNGFKINGIGFLDRSGWSVSSAGDVNGDGLDDLIIGAPYADPNDNFQAGQSYVVFGSNNEFASSLDLSSLDGTNGFTINGIDVGDQLGYSVDGAGDLNADGFDDLIIGARNADPNEENFQTGQSYVVFGSNNEFASNLDVSTLDGTNGVAINGVDFDDYSGFSVSGAGDINGDNFDDLIIGAPFADSNGNENIGESYVIFGSSALAEDNGTTELFRFRNTTFETGTYIFVGEEERDAILANPDFNQTFELEGDGNAAFKASTAPGEDLVPFFRLQSLTVPGTFLFVSTEEYNGIFAEDSAQRDLWVKEGLDEIENDIPEFYLFDAAIGVGASFNRFQNNDNNTFLFAGDSETEAINNDPNLSAVFNDQGFAFQSLP